jgi:hypothetical protein
VQLRPKSFWGSRNLAAALLENLQRTANVAKSASSCVTCTDLACNSPPTQQSPSIAIPKAIQDSFAVLDIALLDEPSGPIPIAVRLRKSRPILIATRSKYHSYVSCRPKRSVAEASPQPPASGFARPMRRCLRYEGTSAGAPAPAPLGMTHRESHKRTAMGPSPLVMPRRVAATHLGRENPAVKQFPLPPENPVFPRGVPRAPIDQLCSINLNHKWEKS